VAGSSTGFTLYKPDSLFSVTVSNITRADLVGKPTVNPGNLTKYFNTAAFANPAKAAGIYIAPGTSGRDILRGPGSSNIDVSLFKDFDVTERVKARFILEAYNLTTRPTLRIRTPL